MFHFPSRLIMDAEHKYGYAREPVFGRLPDGSLISFALSGGPREPDNRNFVLVTRSPDNGDTWSEPSVAFRHGGRGVWATELFLGGPRPMLFVQTYDAFCRYRELQTYVSTTDDNGLTWSEPQSLPSGMRGLVVRQGLVLSNGDWLFPVYWQETRGMWDWTREPVENDMGMHWPKHSGVMISEDEGASYALRGDLSADCLLWEPAVAEHTPGQLLMLIRAERSGVLYQSRSSDYGRTWTPAVPTEIPNPGSKLVLVCVSGRLVLLHNPSELGVGEHRFRQPLAAWCSSDGGVSWSQRVTLASEEPIFYPHLTVNKEAGLFEIACENDRRHYLLRVPFEAVLGSLP
jgi:predicted neuraminidase